MVYFKQSKNLFVWPVMVFLCLSVVYPVSATTWIIEHGNYIAGSPICTQDNGYCAGQTAQGNGSAGYLAEWLNGTHLTYSTLNTSVLESSIHDQDLNTTNNVQFNKLGIKRSPDADLDVNGTMFVYGGNGDVNGDNTLNIGDITEYTKYLTNVSYTWTSGQYGNADVNGDNVVDYLDFDYAWQAFGTSGVTEAQKRDARYVRAGLSVYQAGYAVVGKDPPFAPSHSYVDGEGDLYVIDELEIGNKIYGEEAELIAGGSTQTPLTVKGESSQSANLQEWQDNTGVTLANITSNGEFEGGHTNYYGGMNYHNDSGLTFSIAAQNTYYNITQLTEELTNGFSVSNGVMTVEKAGKYKLQWASSFSGGANTEYHVAVGLNGIEQENCHTARKIGTGGDVGSMGGTCLITLAVNDKLSLMIENEDNTNNIALQDVQFNAIRIGG